MVFAVLALLVPGRSRLAWASADRPAVAEQEPETAQPTPAPVPAVSEKARRLFEEGLVQYQSGAYAQAAKLLEESYALSGAAGLLYDLGQAYRLAGDCQLAWTRYREYLQRAPAAANRARVEARVAELADCAQARQVGTEPPALAPAPTATPPARIIATPARPGADSEAASSGQPDDRRPAAPIEAHRVGNAGIALIGATLALGIAGSWLLAEGTSATDQTSHLFATGGTWNQAAADKQRHGQIATWLGGGLLGGAALTAAGAVWSTLRQGAPGTEAPDRRRRRLSGLALCGGATALGATATFLLVRAHSTDDWISSTFQSGGVWDQESARWGDRARTDQWVGGFLLGAAVLAAASGSWLLFTDGGEAPPAPTVSFGVSPKGWGASWHVVF